MGKEMQSERFKNSPAVLKLTKRTAKVLTFDAVHPARLRREHDYSGTQQHGKDQ